MRELPQKRSTLIFGPATLVLAGSAFWAGISSAQHQDIPPCPSGEGWTCTDNLEVLGCYHCDSEGAGEPIKCLDDNQTSGQQMCNEREVFYNGEHSSYQCHMVGDVCRVPGPDPWDDDWVNPGGTSMAFSIRANDCEDLSGLSSLVFRNGTSQTSNDLRVSIQVPAGAYCDHADDGWTFTQSGNICTYAPAAGASLAKGALMSMRYSTDIDACVLAANPVVFDPAFACTPETDTAFCARLARNCGNVTGTDNCGAERTVASCGSCAGPMTCGGGGTPNLCGVPPLEPVADAFIRDGEPGTNFGTSTTLQVKDQTNNSTNTRRAYLKFGIAGLTGTVGHAKLRLYGSRTNGTTQDAAYAVTSNSWTETGITWNNRPGTGAKLGGNVTITQTAQYYEFDVTNHVAAAQASGSSFVSLAVLPETDTDNAPDSFNSREAATNRPQLVITMALAPVMDAYVREGEPATNFGSESLLKVKDQPNSGNTRHAYLMFDIGSASATVGSAKLRVYGKNGTGTIALGAYAVSDIKWKEDDITWNGRPLPRDKQGGDVLIGTTAKYHEFDVTEFVRDRRALGRNFFAIALLPEDETTNSPVELNSREANTHKPQLIVTP
jgi:hypothetical protein